MRLYADDARIFPRLDSWLRNTLPNHALFDRGVDAVVRASGADIDDVRRALSPGRYSPAVAVANCAPMKGRQHPDIAGAVQLSRLVVDGFEAQPELDSVVDALFSAVLQALTDFYTEDRVFLQDDQLETEVFGTPLTSSGQDIADLRNMIMPAIPIALADLERNAAWISIEPEVLWTILHVEVLGTYHSGFDAARRPIILFERHKFHAMTDGAYDRSHPDISDAKWGGYGPQSLQYARLATAFALAPDAALMACSWGAAQVLGQNHEQIGYPTVTDMVVAMVQSEERHLRAMADFIDAEGIAPKLRDHDWAGFARRYNGPAYAKHHYDTRMRETFALIGQKGLPDLGLRAAQTQLMCLGIPRGPVDGRIGRKTREGLRAFQVANPELEQTGELDPGTAEALRVAVAALADQDTKDLIR